MGETVSSQPGARPTNHKSKLTALKDKIDGDSLVDGFNRLTKGVRESRYGRKIDVGW
jgi:hypothetical protein